MKQRFTALDIFRGMTIAFMIVVNTSGDWSQTFPPLLHAQWYGFTPTDLVFPSFMFAVGNALAFVLGKWQNRSFRDFFLKILKRFVWLFLLGYTMYWIPFIRWTEGGGWEFIPMADTRIWGVLQRIALAYLVCAPLVYFLKQKAIWILSGLMLLAYWAILYAFGDYTLENNAVRTLDLFLFGPKHLYTGDGIPFDPEGLLSTLPTLVNVLAGYLLGIYLKKGKISYEKIAKISLMGAALIFIALCWDWFFPINKKLWTSSYVLLTVGLDLVIIGAIVYVNVFAKRKWKGRFFQTFGKNPLAIYLLSEYIAILMHFFRVDPNTSVYRWVYLSGFDWMGPYWGALAFALSVMFICWLAAKWLENRRIYLKV
ncbi:MAG: DUF5009 domain-containing protein [Bacteroidota bacterium]